MTTFFVPSPADTVRSIFVDHGPIAKAPLTLASGSGAALVDPVTVSLPGNLVTLSMLGKYLQLSGSSLNGGSYRISAILSVSSVRVVASFTLPDTSSGSLGWVIYDPREGQVADDPSDVTVTINSAPVTPVAVVGLLGQIVLSTAPNSGDTVHVGYSWIDNPTVYVVRLNSPEFRLNSWNRDEGVGVNPRRYRYNNVLLTPDDYSSTDMQAVLDQPLQRDLKYRAYERAYTASLNDPTLLLLNSPFNKVSFPPLSRPISPTLVSYGATVLPENDPVAPWVRTGQGTTSLADDFLTATKTTSGPFPIGQVLYWSQPIDLTFPHVFAIAWRGFAAPTVPTEGVFTGVSVGYSDGHRAVVVGLLNDGGTLKIGMLVKGGGNDPSLLTAWSGGLSNVDPTDTPAILDWTTIHSFRLFQDLSGTIQVFIDGDVNPTLSMTEDQIPFLEELNAPFTTVQGVFFGSLSLVASSVSTWNFVRYNIIPTNPFQVAPSVFVNYEATMTPPETDPQPWTPIGYAGTEQIVNSNFLILDSTSASTQAVDQETGLIGGDFRGYDRIEPLLAASSNVVLDVGVQLRTFTHGITPHAVMAAIDDGDRLIQLSFFPDQSAPKLSYGGRSLPTAFQPFTWGSMGSQTGAMVGRTLRITDSSTSDGLVYFIDDTASMTSPLRVLSPSIDYILEFRVLVRAFTPDTITHFCGVSADAFDGVRDVGLMFTQLSGVYNVSFHSEGTALVNFPFNWNDGNAHTYRVVKSTTGNLVSLFIDTVFIGSEAYSSFLVPSGSSSVGVVAFGSATPASLSSTSTIDWTYCNVWRVLSSFKPFVGIWKGTSSGDLTDFHLSLKVSGINAEVSANALGDTSVNFVSSGVAVGDYLVVDVGPNKGMYSIVSVSSNVLTIGVPFPVSHTQLSYRIPSTTDWTQEHRYRIVRNPNGVAVLFDSQDEALIQVEYNDIDLPSSSGGVPRIINGSLSSITFGTFDPTNLSQTSWDFVRYGITRSATGQEIAPHHQVLNRRNVMASPEHLFTSIPHTHTDFMSSSTGIPPEIAPDFLRDPSLVAYTLLNEGTPLVPSTQTFEVRKPTVQQVFVGGLNDINNILNNPSFVLNNDMVETKLVVPEDVLYNSLQVIERDTGETGLLYPMTDRLDSIGTLSFQNTTCLTYDGDVLPENDTSASTPWSLAADDVTHVQRSAFNGVLTFGTDSTGTRTAYKNNTPLPDSIGLVTQVTYRMKVMSDATFGLGDSQIRFGLSAPGMTLAMGFVTTPLGDRYVLVFDQNSLVIVGSRKHDFLDGQFHTYRLVRNPGASSITIFIDS